MHAYAFPMKNEKALMVAKILMDEDLAVFGLAQRLFSNDKRNFKFKVIEQLCKLLHIKILFPHDPKSVSICASGPVKCLLA